MKLLLTAFLSVLMLSGCVYYGAPAYAPASPDKYDRAWAAALNAMSDQSISVVREDKRNGIVEGKRGGIRVTATLDRQSDGGVRVEFQTSGNIDEDRGLIHRVNKSYDSYMGR